MKVCVVIPFGPGHERVVHESIASVEAAAREAHHFLSVVIEVQDDSSGKRGRSRARNDGAEFADADWLLFHDADDLLCPDAFLLLERAVRECPDRELVWGEFWRERVLKDRFGVPFLSEFVKSESQPTPLFMWEHLIANGPLAVSKHGFISRDLFLRLGGWFEPMDIGEDLELMWAAAAHARSFVKLPAPTTRVRYHIPAAGGPRGYLRGTEYKPEFPNPGVAVYNYWKARGPVPWSEAEVKRRAFGLNYLSVP